MRSKVRAKIALGGRNVGFGRTNPIGSRDDGGRDVRLPACRRAGNWSFDESRVAGALRRIFRRMVWRSATNRDVMISDLADANSSRGLQLVTVRPALQELRIHTRHRARSV